MYSKPIKPVKASMGINSSFLQYRLIKYSFIEFCIVENQLRLCFFFYPALLFFLYLFPYFKLLLFMYLFHASFLFTYFMLLLFIYLFHASFIYLIISCFFYLFIYLFHASFIYLLISCFFIYLLTSCFFLFIYFFFLMQSFDTLQYWFYSHQTTQTFTFRPRQSRDLRVTYRTDTFRTLWIKSAVKKYKVTIDVKHFKQLRHFKKKLKMRKCCSADGLNVFRGYMCVAFDCVAHEYINGAPDSSIAGALDCQHDGRWFNLRLDLLMVESSPI